MNVQPMSCHLPCKHSQVSLKRRKVPCRVLGTPETLEGEIEVPPWIVSEEPGRPESGCGCLGVAISYWIILILTIATSG